MQVGIAIFNFASQSSSVWVWLALVLAFCGSLLLFGGALITPWRTNKSWSPRRRPTSSPTRA
jgi:hypothetical protein